MKERIEQDRVIRNASEQMQSALRCARATFRAGLMRQGIYYKCRHLALSEIRSKRKTTTPAK